MDLYNEPLNLSVRSKPVAVVPPSSSNKNYDCNNETRTGTPNNFHSEMSQDESTSDTQNTTENIKTVMHQQYNSSNNNNNNISNVDNAVRNVSEPNLLNLASHANGNRTSATMLSVKKKNLVDNSDDDDEDEDNDSMSRNTSPASVPYQKSAISAILTAYMENFHEHQQSLDAAKLHLQQYLKLTNQYLQKYAELIPSDMSIAASSTQSNQNTVGSNNSSGNDTINNIIHTNILTNKITTNNLISIINKLLEQNIVSEFYFKHATAFQEQQKLRQDICHDELDYDGPTTGVSGMSASIALMGNGTSNIINSSGAMVAGGMLGGMILDQLSLSNNNNGASNNTRHDRHSVMLSDNNNSSLMTTNAVLGGIGGLTAPLFMNQSHANKLKTMKNLAMIARERYIQYIYFM